MADSDSASYSSVASTPSKGQHHAASSRRTSSSSSRASSSSSQSSKYQATSSQRSTSPGGHHAALSYGTSISPEPLLLPSRQQKVPSSPGLSAEEFKARLYRSFKDRGLVDSLKVLKMQIRRGILVWFGHELLAGGLKVDPLLRDLKVDAY